MQLKFIHFSVLILLLNIYSHAQETNDEGSIYYNDAIALHESGKFDSAIIFYRKSAAWFEENNQIEKSLQSEIKIATAYVNKSKSDSALMISQNLIPRINEQFGPNSRLAGLNYAVLGKIYKNLEKYEESLRNSTRADSILTVIEGEIHSKSASIHFDKAYTLDRLYRPEEALVAIQKSEEVYLLDSAKNVRDLCLVYLDKSLIYTNLGMMQLAEKALNNAIILQEKVYADKHSKRAVLYNRAAMFYTRYNKHEQALAYFKSSLEVFSSYLPDPHIWIAYVNMNVGGTYISLKDYSPARIYLSEGMRMIRELYGEDHYAIASGYDYLGFIERKIGNPQKALDFLSKSLKLKEKLFGSNHFDVARANLELAKVYLEEGDFELAKKYLDQTYDITSNLHKTDYEFFGTIQYWYGRLYKEHKNYSEALEALQLGIIATTVDFKENDIASFPPVSDLKNGYVMLDLLFEKGEVLLKQYDLSDSLYYLELAEKNYALTKEVSEKLWPDNQRTSEVLEIVSNYALASEILAEIYMEKSKIEKNPAYIDSAFFLNEKSRNISLKANVYYQNEKSSFNVPDSLIQKELNLNERITHYKSKEVSSDHQSDSLLAKKNEAMLFEANKELDRLTKLFKEEYKDYFQLKYQNNAVSIHDLQSNARANQAFLEYFEGDSVLHVFAINQTEKKVYSIPLDSSYQQAVHFFSTLDKHQRNGKIIDYKKHALYLFEKLLKKPLKGLGDEITTLTIIPSLELTTIPWELLISNEVGESYSDLNYLLKDYTISYSYSASLMLSEKRETSTSQSLLAFAPVYEEASDYVAELNSEFRDELIPLKWNDDEATTVAGFFDGKALIGDQATERSFKDQVQDYQILHLAMHALVDHEESMHSKLVFTNNNDAEEDGMLHTFELFNMEIPAEMVVLSACNTGIGKLQKGEGVMSLARGFAFAGVPSIVMSHWNVNDESTSKLMTHFYQHLAEGDPKDEALRKAKLDFLTAANEIQMHPFFWGGFVVVGDTSPIDQNKNSLLWFLLVFPVIGFLLISRKKR